MSLIEKIDAEIAKASSYEFNTDTRKAYRSGLNKAKEFILSEQKEPCKGCKHYGNYENEVEYGYSSPCTKCKRRCVDNYQPYATDNNVVTK